MAQTEKKMIELWDGFEVEFNDSLFDDVDFASDLADAIKENDLSTLVMMYMALVGGDDTYEKVRDHIEDEYGHFSMKGLKKITEKIENNFPKAGNRALRRSWRNSR